MSYDRFYLYRIINLISGRYYIGMSNDIVHRWASHKSSAKSKKKSPIYCAMRSYGIENFKLEIIEVFDNRETCGEAEILEIQRTKDVNYNLHPGGKGGFSMLSKSPEEIEAWRAKSRESRKGKTPAKGMKHTEENKKLFSEVSRGYWDSQYVYPREEILALSFIDANKQYGISKTHYYRLRKYYVK